MSEVPRDDTRRALHVLHVDTERSWRGGQAQIAILMDALARLGHRSTLAAPQGPLAERATASGHAHVLFAPQSDLDLAAAFSLARSARLDRPDVVHLHSGRAQATGWPAARASGAACVVTRRVLFERPGTPPRSSLKLRLPLERVIAISTAIERALVRAGVPRERLAVVPDALEVAAFERAVAEARASGAARALRAAWGVPEDARLVGMLAAFTPEKDYATFVAAAARVIEERPVAGFVGIGEGPGLEAMRAEVERRGLAQRIRLPGSTPDVAAAMAALDAFALLSTAEGLGSSILLAQAAGLPVVATNVGGIPDLIEHGVTGTLVAPADGEAAARAFVEVLGGGPEVAHRVEESRRRLERFDAAHAAAEHERLYRDAIGVRASGRPWEGPR